MADRRRASVRLRTTLGATAVVGLALVLGGVLLLHLVQSTLTAGSERAARVRAQELVALLARPVTPGDLSLEGDDTAFVQVLDETGLVVAASAVVADRPALVTTTTPDPVRLDPGPIGDGEAFVAVALRSADGRWRVVAGRSLEPVTDATEIVTAALVVGLPLLMGLVATTAWVVTGRALRPVEAVRREVASISALELDRRVPVPGGGDEVTRLAVTMNAMLDRLERARVTQQRFVADASHELRSPLTSVRHQLEVALAHPDGTTVPTLSADLLAQTQRLGRLTEDLLLLARSDAGTEGPARRPVDLDDLVLAEASRLRRLGRVDVDTGQVGAAQVLGDAPALGRLVRNLVENAERHAHSRVCLVLQAAGGQAQLEVSDDGAGIEVADRERVFERFTRLDDARARDTGGSGLGLAIVREVVRAHHGTVAIEDGARFVVRLPLAP